MNTDTHSQFSLVPAPCTGYHIATYQEGPLTMRLVNSLIWAVQGAVGHSTSTTWPGIIRRTRYMSIARDQAPGRVLPADFPPASPNTFLLNLTK